ncbi:MULTISPECIES: DUF6249 domain-containing protein [unclassified Roseateles]|uniref:DUF6249 domain-containing protein n=1 Tax=unclassified Roseateles TaxID=2626991 RepID=UPI00070045FC|nr:MULTISPECIES: DUF6249 domain-containing protein [unclassified Roseateles]KQW44647.1 hypothetical protein ASC81_13715 [Pelomonas sp. Root405]KRA70006.1 hypothetical protein ASD88_17875 [Pelomonas sp. Root662]
MLFDLQNSLPLFIPILALFIPIVAILAHYIGKAHTERQRHETIRELARAGQPIPPELLGEAQDSDWHRARRDQANPNRILVPAIINIAVGLGLMGMFSMMMPGAWLWSIGLLPMFIGIGLALYWAVERKQQPPRQQP